MEGKGNPFYYSSLCCESERKKRERERDAKEKIMKESLMRVRESEREKHRAMKSHLFDCEKALKINLLIKG